MVARQNERGTKDSMLTRETTITALESISKSDPVMMKLISLHGPCDIAFHATDPFEVLVKSIVGQQLSGKAASTIRRRVWNVLDGDCSPKSVLEADPNGLRLAGLSIAKQKYIKGVASRVLTAGLDFGRISEMENEEAISSLMEIPGIGRWTAEMFLVFGLKRPDVLALSDSGLLRASSELYSGHADKKELLKTVSESWRPFRSVGSWYLWKHLDSK